MPRLPRSKNQQSDCTGIIRKIWKRATVSHGARMPCGSGGRCRAPIWSLQPDGLSMRTTHLKEFPGWRVEAIAILILETGIHKSKKPPKTFEDIAHIEINCTRWRQICFVVPLHVSTMFFASSPLVSPVRIGGIWQYLSRKGWIYSQSVDPEQK